jgi:4-amino-4-deoxy-L-arabinose transferase-like glycosyltransferase
VVHVVGAIVRQMLDAARLPGRLGAPPNRRIAVWIGLIVVLNLVVRTAWVIDVHPYPSSDFGFYVGAAMGLAAGHGYLFHGLPTAYWPIGWPLVLAALYLVFGPHLWVGLAFQIVATTAVAVLVLVLAYRLTGSLGIGVAAALAWSLLPEQLGWTSLEASEPLFTLLLIATLLVLTHGTDLRHMAVAGLLLGAACIVRPTVLLFPFALVLILALRWRQIRRAVVAAAALGVCMMLVVAPLTIRNEIALGSPVLVSTNGGVNLWQGVHADDYYWWSTDPAVNPLISVSDEVARDALGQKLFLDFALAHPTYMAVHGVIKMAALYSPRETVWRGLDAGWGDLRTRLTIDGSEALYVVFMIFALIGIAIGVRRYRWKGGILVGFLIYYTAVFSVFPAWDRFRYPLLPIFAVFAGIALQAGWDRIAPRVRAWRRPVAGRTT